jgi:hypothetical protein
MSTRHFPCGKSWKCSAIHWKTSCRRTGRGWWPGDDPAAGKLHDDGLFGLFKRYIESAHVQAREQLGEGLEFKGLFWHQGESDVGGDAGRFQQATRTVSLPVTEIAFDPDRKGEPNVHFSLTGCHELGPRMVEALAREESQDAAGAKVK